ncbi:hypothetical protein [Actinomadura chibensis]|uniref:GlsB/YeaQ/YmgE family stress response membrane protein n=1 Tax=Actinomadura chibensis TaxID=392828 RepID=A0A5D0NB00_9ACTN|nr:hypothetical protein [Actinomadura chibensis]TYB41491.1 GlsB/YeaQ/YmgE family stress response membrane protein [Actinomadura chibensis]
MSVAGLAAAVVLGAVVGALGRLVAPGRETMPGWCTVAVGVVAAFAGTGIAHLFGLGSGGWGGWSVWEFLFQLGLAAAGVFLVALCWPKRIAPPPRAPRPPRAP